MDLKQSSEKANFYSSVKGCQHPFTLLVQSAIRGCSKNPEKIAVESLSQLAFPQLTYQ